MRRGGRRRTGDAGWRCRGTPGAGSVSTPGLAWRESCVAAWRARRDWMARAGQRRWRHGTPFAARHGRIRRCAGTDPTIPAAARRQIAVELRDCGRADSLESQISDTRPDMPIDQVTIVLQCLGLDLNRMCFDPLVKVRSNGDRVVVDVLALAGFDAGLVAGGLGGFLGGEPADPSRLADPCLGVLDADDV